MPDRWRTLAWAAAAFLTLTPPVWGADQLTPLIDPQTGELPSFAQLFMFSPFINGAIALLSAIALLLFFYFLLTVRTAMLAPASLVNELTKLVVAGKFEEAASVCRNHRAVFLASVVQRCVENAGKEHALLMDMIESEGRRRADILWNRISYLADVANVAPMLGLLGTVVGMIRGFFLLPRETGSVTSRLLAESIGQAMSTTMFGLVVAISSLLFYSLVKSRATRCLAEVEQIVHALGDHIKRWQS